MVERVIFDSDDINRILTMPDGERTVLRFTPAELRQQIHATEIHAAVSRAFGEDDLAYYYNDAVNTFRLALDILICTQPQPTCNGASEHIDTESIKAKVNIVDIAEQYTKLRKSGNRFVGSCPFHDEKSPSFTVYPENQSWFCFSCNRGGDVIDLTMAVEHIDFKAAAGVLTR